MRLWHYELVKNGLLPKSQLISQWRELNCIYAKQPRHILINYVYEYSTEDLFYYSYLVIKELTKLKTKNGKDYNIKLEKYENYFKNFSSKCNIEHPFENHHDDEYLEICYWNLREKYMRGQKDFDDTLYQNLTYYFKIHKHISL